MNLFDIKNIQRSVTSPWDVINSIQRVFGVKSYGNQTGIL